MNKGDDDNPVSRSRMVGKEFNDKVIGGLFAATPPLEALRLLLSWAATTEGKRVWFLRRCPTPREKKGRIDSRCVQGVFRGTGEERCLRITARGSVGRK